MFSQCAWDWQRSLGEKLTLDEIGTKLNITRERVRQIELRARTRLVRAAIRAGYSAKTANASGPRLLVNVSIQLAIREARAKTAEKLDLSREWVLLRLRENCERAMNGTSWNPGAANKSLELIARMQGYMNAAEDADGLAVRIVFGEGP